VILFELCGGNEAHPVYQALEVANGNRQYDFLRSIVGASLGVGRPFLSGHVIKALNFQAIACLHAYAGEYRPCRVTVGAYHPPEHYRVDGLMEDFVNFVNRTWETTDPLALAAFVLWRLNHIHPFINGNGRTARAASYFVLCVKVGQWLPGTTILPELLRRERARYVEALQHADASTQAGSVDLAPLHALIAELLAEQINGGNNPPPTPDAAPVAPAPPPPPAA
jgi:prophage maintenance system killer protein